jgi:hypothetical protein
MPVADAPSIPGAAPRVALYSARYEATAVADHDTLAIHLDRFATNAPVTDAQLTVGAGTARGPAERLPDGSYRFRHAAVEAPGALSLRLEVAEPGQPPDTLAGTLRTGPAPDDGPGSPGPGRGDAGSRAAHASWRHPALWGLALLALAGGALALLRRRRDRASSAPTDPRALPDAPPRPLSRTATRDETP